MNRSSSSSSSTSFSGAGARSPRARLAHALAERLEGGDSRNALDLLAGRLRRSLGADAVWILAPLEVGEFRIAGWNASAGNGETAAPGVAVIRFASWVSETGEPGWSQDPVADARFEGLNPRDLPMAAWPLLAESKTVGVAVSVGPASGVPAILVESNAGAQERAVAALLLAFEDQRRQKAKTLHRYEELERRQVRSEREGALGRAAREAVPEMQGTLRSLKAMTRRLRSPEGADEAEAAAALVSAQIERLERALDQIEALGTAIEEPLEMDHLNRLVEEGLSAVASLVKRKRLRIRRKFAEDVPEMLIPVRILRRSLTQILCDAAEGATEGGRLLASTVRRGSSVELRIAAEAAVQSGSALDRLWVPFGDSAEAANLPFDSLRRLLESMGATVETASGQEWGIAYRFVFSLAENRNRRTGTSDRRRRGSDPGRRAA